MTKSYSEKIIMKEQLLEHVKAAKGKNILVIGDVMLDVHIQGSVSRISPEAPVPVLHVGRETHFPGGAGHVCSNLNHMGANVILCGITGDDAQRFTLLQELELRNIQTQGLLSDPSRPTTRKVKLLGRGNHMIRLDYEQEHNISASMEKELLQSIKKTLPLAHSVIISDYAKGTVTPTIAQEIISLAKSYNVPTICDVKPQCVQHYSGATLVTLNVDEAQEITKSTTVQEMGRELANSMQSNILITAGGSGAYLTTTTLDCTHIPADKQEVIDKTGVGDVVTAAIGLAFAGKAPLEHSAHLGIIAGGIKVTKAGLATVSAEDFEGNLHSEIRDYLLENIKVKQRVIENSMKQINEIVRLITETYSNGHKVLVFGNGGSASDAMHMVGELVGRFKVERKGLPAISLVADSAVLTAVGNDYGYENIFSRQVEAYCTPGDVLIGISTSGNSPNVIKAINLGNEMGAKTITLLGKDGGKLKDLADVTIVVPSDNTPRIQETHITLIHIICEMLDKRLLEKGLIEVQQK